MYIDYNLSGGCVLYYTISIFLGVVLNIINKLLNKSITIDDAFNGDIYNSFFGRITLLTNINLKLIHVRLPWFGSNETRSPTDGSDGRGLLQTAA